MREIVCETAESDEREDGVEKIYQRAAHDDNGDEVVAAEKLRWLQS